MKIESNTKFFDWMGKASVGAVVGLAAGLLLGLATGGGLGVWFWVSLASDGINPFGKELENFLALVITVVLAVVGAVVGAVGGAIAGLIVSSLIGLFAPKPIARNN